MKIAPCSKESHISVAARAEPLRFLIFDIQTYIANRHYQLFEQFRFLSQEFPGLYNARAISS